MHFASSSRRPPRLMIWIALAFSAAWLPAQSFDLDRDRESVVSLDSQWRFHPGDSPPAPGAISGSAAPLWASPAFDDSAWPLLNSNQSWSTQGYPGMSGYAWYRFKVRIPACGKPASILLAPLITTFEVYIDGQRKGASGPMKASSIPSTYFRYILFPLTGSGSDSPRQLQVAIRVWHSPIWAGYVGGGPYHGGHLAGDPALLLAEQQHHQVARNVHYIDAYSYSILAALIGFAILCLFVIRPAEREYLWFALMLLSQAADNALFVGEQIYSWPPVPVYDLADGILTAINIGGAFCFFFRVLGARRGVAPRILLSLVVLSPFAAVFYWPEWFSVPASAATQLACLLPSVAWILVLLLRRAIGGNLDARLLLLPTLLDLGYYFADNLAIILAQAGWTRMPRILELPLPLPPFTMQTGILIHLFFLLALLVFLIRRFTLARRREERMAGEFEAARQVQQVLLPDALDQCPGFAMACVYRPAERVGGDFFQQIGDGQGGMTIVVGDVSGKGLPAAMMVAMLTGAIRTEAAHGTTPTAILAALNDRMMGRNHGGFATCLAAHITALGKLTLANAGHLPPYLNGQELPLPGSLPLGILAGAGYETMSVNLKPGDRLTFISDGVVEAYTRSGELFGFDRARDLSRSPATLIADAAQAFGQRDDITVVTVEYSGAAHCPGK